MESMPARYSTTRLWKECLPGIVQPGGGKDALSGILQPDGEKDSCQV